MEAEFYGYTIPLWVFLLILRSPAIIISMIGHLIVDSLVLAGCYYLYKRGPSLKLFYKKHIFRVWLWGVLANVIGIFIFYLPIPFDFIGSLQYQWDKALQYEHFLHHLFVFVCFSMLMSAVLVFACTYFFTFRGTISDRRTRLKLAATITLLTVPWTLVTYRMLAF